MAAVKRRKSSRQRPKRDKFLGFVVPGRPRPEGRLLAVPRTCLSAQGGGIAYDDNMDWAEGEPEELKGHP